MAYQVLSAGTGGGSALLGWWWSYGGDDGVARRELAHGYGDGGAAGARLLLRRGREAGKSEMRAWDGSGRRWRGYGRAQARRGLRDQGVGDARPLPRTHGAHALAPVGHRTASSADSVARVLA